MATLRAAATRHRHIEQFSGILTWPLPQEEEGIGKSKAQNGTQTASYCNNTLRRNASKQLRI